MGAGLLLFLALLCPATLASGADLTADVEIVSLARAGRSVTLRCVVHEYAVNEATLASHHLADLRGSTVTLEYEEGEGAEDAFPRECDALRRNRWSARLLLDSQQGLHPVSFTRRGAECEDPPIRVEVPEEEGRLAVLDGEAKEHERDEADEERVPLWPLASAALASSALLGAFAYYLFQRRKVRKGK